MKPSAFTYHAPRDVDETLVLLDRHGHDGKLLAGGQSLVPVLNFRLARPEHIIDLNHVACLAGISRRRGTLRIGAMTRQSTLEASPLVAEHWPLLTESVSYVAHPQIRNRGTVGGSTAHADPAAELPVALAALDARFHLRSRRGERRVVAADMFIGQMTTTIQPDELLMAIEVPPLPARTGHAFVEFARRHGDFALGGAAVLLSVDDAGTCTRARICLLGAGAVPIRAAAAEQGLTGMRTTDDVIHAAAALAVEGVAPSGDIHGSSEYRVTLLERLVRRALRDAGARAAAAEHESGTA